MTPVATTTTIVQPDATQHATLKHRHPLDALRNDEISTVSLAVREYGVKHGVKAVKFININLLAPPKRDVLANLGIPLNPGEVASKSNTSLKRRAEADVIDVVEGSAYAAILTLNPDDSVWTVDDWVKLPVGTQPQITVEELLESEEIIRKDPQVIKLAADVGVQAHELCADGWSIGYDDRFPDKYRLQQCLLYARFKPDDNIYAHPLDFFPVVDGTSKAVLHIDFPAHRDAASKLIVSTTAAPPLDAPNFGLDRDRIAPPKAEHEYLPDLIKDIKLRDDIKPLHVVQPQGVSFTMNGNEIEWQKWKMHVSFNGREGLVLSTITYNDDGEVRPLLYRVSLAEMVVPYAAPEHPHPRKFAFDVGEYGMGAMANDLTLGCDCLGTIQYLPGSYVAHNGQPVKIKRAVCIHEEDAGILWKHTDFREKGRSHCVRSRKLVVSMVATVANYEYCFYYNFYQDGTIELETRLTGILNIYVAGENETTPHATMVAPQVQGQYHQHIFSLRIDPMIDGMFNSVTETDVISSPFPTGHPQNFAGNAFGIKTTTIAHSSEGAREYDFEADRRWTIVNPARKHYASGRSVGYAIGMKGAAVRLLAKPDSWIARRATFASKDLWVVRNEDGREFPAGRYVPQTRTSPVDSVGEWVKDNKTLDNEDILLFLTFGTTHIPRPEDWPVMPVEHIRITLKPSNFFKHSPALDVPSSTDSKSYEAFSGLGGVPPQGAPEVSDASCCA